ncbi:MAG: SDR family NAD(P)-dependent oxidoreductase [Candidatus Parabeggiatoa sp. nov. 1]|nr:MAG: SDR family NAD(P)-dependent oxidoreductase [Gammaproteobacteria bacterium]
MSKESQPTHISTEELATCTKVLQAIYDDPDLLPEEEMLSLVSLMSKIFKASRKKLRQRERLDRQNQKRVMQEATLRCQAEPLDEMNLASYKPVIAETTQTTKRSLKVLKCYICQAQYQDLHFFYHRLCPTCATYNYTKREQRIDLSGRTALVTGGRVKLGYGIALKLLRDGARVIVLTRFARDAAQRYAQESDFEDWAHNLKIYGLDLKNIPLVENFIFHLLDTEDYLDIIINNAAQTIKRPDDFYAHLLPMEKATVPEKLKTLLADNLTANDILHPIALPINTHFPTGKYDLYGEQIDLRTHNSWTSKLEEIGTIELLEVQLINAVAPFLLNSRLKPLLLKSPHSNRFIVNVSSAEGQFSHQAKSATHPHTNMAKAALNMITRTSATDYAKYNIFMNSVDPGWFTQENPYPIKTELRQQGMVPPLDIIDGAARLYDPIIQGIKGSPCYGQLLKDYRPREW